MTRISIVNIIKLRKQKYELPSAMGKKYCDFVFSDKREVYFYAYIFSEGFVIAFRKFKNVIRFDQILLISNFLN